MGSVRIWYLGKCIYREDLDRYSWHVNVCDLSMECESEISLMVYLLMLLSIFAQRDRHHPLACLRP